MSLRLRITYGRTADFLADVAQQVSKRGMLVRVEVAAVERGEPLELVIVTPVGSIVVPATVLQPMGGAGVAVELDPARFDELVAAAQRRPVDAGGSPPRHEEVTADTATADEVALAPVIDTLAADAGAADAGADAHPTAERRAGAESAALALQQAQKIQQALHGDKNQRMAILREPNKLFHGYVLRNPQLQLEEVLFVVRNAMAAVDLLTFIAARREWAERPEVAVALVRNPKTPVPLAIKLLNHVAPAELRSLAKQQSLREGIQRAVRKKVLG